MAHPHPPAHLNANTATLMAMATRVILRSSYMTRTLPSAAAASTTLRYIRHGTPREPNGYEVMARVEECRTASTHIDDVPMAPPSLLRQAHSQSYASLRYTGIGYRCG